MKEICLPLDGIPDNSNTEVIVKTAASGYSWHYRIESFDFKLADNIETRIKSLQDQIKKYNPQWELIQIIDTNESQSCVHVLYREKKENE